MRYKTIWITGFSGAGKTTVGRLLYDRLKSEYPILLLDGDHLREVFGDRFGYTERERRACAMTYARLCKMISDQSVCVICCTVSMFEDVREWNRMHLDGYFEIYLRVSEEALLRRNQKGLYSSCRSELSGFGVEAEEPANPDMVIDNNGAATPEEIVDKIIEVLER